MKKIKNIVFVLLLFVNGFSYAQTDAISKYFSEYEDDRSNTVISVSGRMFSIFTNFEVEDEEDQAIINMMSKLTGLKVITNSNTDDGFADYKKFLKTVPANVFEELMTVRDDEKDMKFLIREKNGNIDELLMISGSRREFIILSIVGNIDLKQIALLSKRMDISGLEELENLDDN